MIKRILVAIMIALPMIGFAQAKFAVVNSQAIFVDHPDTKAAQEQLQAAAQKFQDEFKKLSDEFDKKYAAFQELPEDTPKSIRDRQMGEIQNMNNSIQQFRLNADEDLQKQQEQLLAPIQQKIADAVQAVGKEGNYTFIFEAQMPNYVGADVTDVTSLVRSKLGIK
ncbi:MAG: OmpH family outer membrane protein [Bacteroides sp.]|nr:OmpH family outer membrane protein [Barnesiella sp.]MBD5324748.1 OmpH family outer membrane protein [Bacteroides sp.]MBD5331509.1 OmpH family outer membrane protein [Bacteroides sp.]MBD5374108.1 OmpH family outer membrane protein [Bacteroides sp.]MDE7460634.1 OmpH family outer membrane protein [Paramuribaculum sp.]